MSLRLNIRSILYLLLITKGGSGLTAWSNNTFDIICLNFILAPFLIIKIWTLLILFYIWICILFLYFKRLTICFLIRKYIICILVMVLNKQLFKLLILTFVSFTLNILRIVPDQSRFIQNFVAYNLIIWRIIWFLSL